MNQQRGFQEINHTADLELNVWAENLPELFTQSALGMYHLAQVVLREEGDQRVSREIELEAFDRESVLIAFLDELLFFLEDEQLAFPELALTLPKDTTLQANMHGYPVLEQHRDIKAVTFHQLDIQKKQDGYTVNIVFDI
jgi:SHS2 domain-containing protein